MLPTILKLAEDGQWRIRHYVMKYIRDLANSEAIGSDYLTDKVADLVLTWLNDSVYSIRVATIDIIKDLTSTYGVNWVMQHIIPRVYHITLLIIRLY